MATIVTAENFDSEVIKSNTPVLIDFYADWCGPCKMIAPIIDELAEEMAGKAKIVKIDVDNSHELAQKYGVMSIPTLVFIKNGEEIDRLNGAVPKDTLEEKLKALM